MEIDKEIKELKEPRQHSSILKLYSLYECLIPNWFPNVPMHWHSEYEIDIVFAGEGEFICGDERFFVEKGDIILIPPNMLHAAFPKKQKSLHYKALVFHENLLGVGENDRTSLLWIRPLTIGKKRCKIKYSKECSEHEELFTSIQEVIRLADINDAYQDILLKAKLLQAFWLFLKKENVYEGAENTGNSEMIRPAIEYMNMNFMENISIDELAKKCTLSSSYFMNIFSQVTGTSAIEYLTHIRIKSACNELCIDKLNIAEIASNCGYSNLSNFNRQFKKIIGVTPREYKKTVAFHEMLTKSS